ncbi:hypothetical protein [Halomonas rhizosphaerae]|uniref:Uncharacterized protein n=1 Tax=Halomonas rhizosphaerae TaxID=3043296 RepID=A0ABT6V3I5_9GAMM|nr:hypothetical protein [Halomonas rhizosphaerae]MDI5891799.1 hypothetical protein [Halomonas rhizosphaerae]
MNDKQKAELDDAISSLEHRIMGLAITLSMANTKLDELRSEVDQLKAIRDGKRPDLLSSLDFALDLPDFIEAIPSSVRGRIIALAQELEETGDTLLDRLWQETRALLLYDAIYADVDAEYDLPNPILSRTIRGCIDHAGRVPDGADRDTLLCECPQILAAIESAYQKHIRVQLQAMGKQAEAHLQTMGKNYR